MMGISELVRTSMAMSRWLAPLLISSRMVSSVWLNAALILGFGLMTIYSLINLIQTIRQPAAKRGEGAEA